MLTLKPAFEDANKARLIEKVLHETPVLPRTIDPPIPRNLETVVLKCLAKDPAQRYATAEETAEDLRCFLADRPIRARRTPWYEFAWRWRRRNPWVAGLSAALLLVLIGTAVGGVAAGTVHFRVAPPLLNLFELVIGEVDMILGNLDEEREFEDVVADLWAESDDLADFRTRMEQLGERLLAAKEAYFEQRSHDDKIFGDEFRP